MVLIGGLIYNVRKQNREIKNWNNYLVIGKSNLLAVYGKKFTLKIPFDISIDKDVSFRDLVSVKNYEEILKRVNDILPEKLDHYKVIKYGEINTETKHQLNIPEVMVNDKRHILTSSTESLFNKYLREKNTKYIANEDIVVDILNANGIPGHARRTGERMSKELGVKYTAANYERNGEQSYILINDLPNKKIEDLVMLVKEKYLKIREDSNIPSLANVVFVLGKEQEKIFNVEIEGDSQNAEDYAKILKDDGYNYVTRKKVHIDKADRFINYNSEDYYIAYKIGQKLGINKYVEKNSLKNKIEVVTE